MPRIPKQDLVEFGARLLAAKGLRPDDARYVAVVATDVAAMGIATHGLPQWSVIVSLIDQGQIHPRGIPQIVRQRAATALIDANGAPGQVAMRLAVATALEKARLAGVGWASVYS